MRAPFILLAGLGVSLLAACDLTNPSPLPSSRLDSSEPAPDRYHLKSFSWDSARGSAWESDRDGYAPSPLAKAFEPRLARFETREAWGEALRALHAELEKPGASDSLWKPLDLSCPEVDLALWNRHGTVWLGDSLILDEALLRARCRSLAEPGDSRPLAKGAAFDIAESQHRVHPYKMIGRAWSDLDLFVKRSSGAETQFKKERESFGIRAWWDTDATRIGVRLYLLDCGGSPRVCYPGGEKSNWHRNSNSVLQTELADASETRVQTSGLPAGVKRLNLKVSAAVIALHSADHAGIRFRAVSMAGLSPATPRMSMPATEYVTW